MCKKSNSNVITIWGGPNFPIDFPSQKKFMRRYPEVDVYVPTEGELGFSNVIKLILETDSLKNAKQTILKNTIDGCISRSETGDIHYDIPTLRVSSPVSYTHLTLPTILLV